jgi:hypothetical protein
MVREASRPVREGKWCKSCSYCHIQVDESSLIASFKQPVRMGRGTGEFAGGAPLPVRRLVSGRPAVVLRVSVGRRADVAGSATPPTPGVFVKERAND